MADYKKFSLRLDYDNPEHDQIMTVLDNVDKERYKSKTQFVICALKHYIDFLNIENGEEILKERTKNLEEILITRREFEDRMALMKEEVKSELYEDIIRIIGSAGKMPEIKAGEQVSSSSQGDPESGFESSDTIENDLAKYSGIMDSVMSWSCDD